MKKDIYTLRKLSGFNQKKMAELLGIDENSYQRKEQGVRPFYFDEAKKVSEILGIKLSEIKFEGVNEVGFYTEANQSY